MSQAPAQWSKLSTAERWIALKHPMLAHEAFKLGLHASKRARSIVDGPAETHNTEIDALRHCYWSALLSRHLGEEFAERVGDAHEARPNNTPNEEAADQYNDRVGRILARIPGSDEALFDRCREALWRGELRYLVSVLPFRKKK